MSTEVMKPEPVEGQVEVEAIIESGMLPSSLDEQLAFCRTVVRSGLVPVKRASECFVILRRGAELGFKPLASFEVLYVVNGRVRLTPNGAKAKAQASGLLEDAKEWTTGEGDALEGHVIVKRRGLPTEIKADFSIADAKKAGLMKGGSAWEKYPKRMVLARPRGFAYADAFTDLIGGLPVRETFDLDPGEKIGGEAEDAPAALKAPPAGPDPLLSLPGPEQGATPQGGVTTGHPDTGIRDLPADSAESAAGAGPEQEVVPPPPVSAPAAAPFATHAEADAAIAAADRRAEKQKGCAHARAPIQKRRGKPDRRVCLDCLAVLPAESR